MNKRIVVPEGMLKAAYAKVGSNADEMLCGVILESACRWLSGNPIYPDPEQEKELWRTAGAGEWNEAKRAAAHAVEWQRRMFLAPPDPDEPINDLLLSVKGCSVDEIDKRIREAYRRGLKR